MNKNQTAAYISNLSLLEKHLPSEDYTEMYFLAFELENRTEK